MCPRLKFANHHEEDILERERGQPSLLNATYHPQNHKAKTKIWKVGSSRNDTWQFWTPHNQRLRLSFSIRASRWSFSYLPHPHVLTAHARLVGVVGYVSRLAKRETNHVHRSWHVSIKDNATTCDSNTHETLPRSCTVAFGCFQSLVFRSIWPFCPHHSYREWNFMTIMPLH